MSRAYDERTEKNGGGEHYCEKGVELFWYSEKEISCCMLNIRNSQPFSQDKLGKWWHINCQDGEIS